MILQFEKIHNYHRGILSSLLHDAYSYDPRNVESWSGDWQEFDDFFFDHPNIADRCGFITSLHGEAIGFASWDPRKSPELVQIGHNCIATKYKGNGYGTLQMNEMVRRIGMEGTREIVVTTNATFSPARNMYQRAGLREYDRRKNDETPFAGDYIDMRMIFDENHEI